jgi:hypothetical protein
MKHSPGPAILLLSYKRSWHSRSAIRHPTKENENGERTTKERSWRTIRRSMYVRSRNERARRRSELIANIQGRLFIFRATLPGAEISRDSHRGSHVLVFRADLYMGGHRYGGPLSKKFLALVFLFRPHLLKSWQETESTFFRRGVRERER